MKTTIFLMTIEAGTTRMPLGSWFYKLKQLADKLYPKYGNVNIEFRVNEGDVDVVAVVEEKHIAPKLNIKEYGRITWDTEEVCGISPGYLAHYWNNRYGK